MEQLGIPAVVIDRDGIIIDATSEWLAVTPAAARAGADVGIGADYVAVTRRAALRGCTDAAAVLVAFDEVRAHKGHREVRYSCPTDAKTRVHRLQVMPASADADRLLLLHLPDDGRSDTSAVEAHQAGIFHDLVTPLQIAYGWSELLVGDYRELDDELVESAVRAVHRHLDYAVALVSSRSQRRVALTGVELAPAVTEAARDYEELRVSQEGTHGVVVRSSDVAVSRVLRNLFSNARKYGRAPVRVTARPAGRRVLVTVSDGGSSVPEDIADVLFGVGVRSGAHDTIQGDGRGLAIVRALMRDIGGTVTLDREAPTTTFVLDFALAPAETGAAVADGRATASTPPAGAPGAGRQRLPSGP